MRFHWLQHVEFEDAACIGDWAVRQGFTMSQTRLFEDEALPDVNEIDGLAIMGGPMNIYQHRDHPWLVKEKKFIEKTIGAGVPTIGVCLGSQLLADVLGAKVSQNPYIEIGWFDMALTEKATDCELVKGLPQRFTAFQWHGDTFEIPPDAKWLAQSQACRNQAFAYDCHVLGLQFHIEYSAESIRQMIAHCGHELVKAPFVQTAEEITAGLPNVQTMNQHLFTLLEALFSHGRG
jgi:GMP synthase-like glutamine amidotransferase